MGLKRAWGYHHLFQYNTTLCLSTAGIQITMQLCHNHACEKQHRTWLHSFMQFYYTGDHCKFTMLPFMTMLDPMLYYSGAHKWQPNMAELLCNKMYLPSTIISYDKEYKEHLNSFTPMSWWQRLMTYLPFTTMSRSQSQRLFDLKVNKPLTCHWFTRHVDLDDFDLALSRY